MREGESERRQERHDIRATKKEGGLFGQVARLLDFSAGVKDPRGGKDRALA